MDGETVDKPRDGDSGIEIVDLESTIADARSTERDDDGSPTEIPTLEPESSFVIEPDTGTKRRGRKPGSKNRATREQSQKEQSMDLTSLLLSTHFMLAKLTKIDELELEEDEAKRLGDAMARVQKEFGFKIIDPKTAALINLGVAAVGVYGTRAVAIYQNSKQQKKVPQGQVVSFSTGKAL
jgi:hypothetical protein